MTAVADSSTMSAEVCIVATSATSTSAESAGGAKPRTAPGRACAAAIGGRALRAASAIDATERPKSTFEPAASSAERRAVSSSRQESSFR